MVGVDRRARLDAVKQPHDVAAPDRNEFAVTPGGQHIFLQQPVDLVARTKRIAADVLRHELIGHVGEGERTLSSLLPHPFPLGLRVEPGGDLRNTGATD